MTIEQIKERVASSEYDFLRTNEHLGNNIILLTREGDKWCNLKSIFRMKSRRLCQL